VSTKIISLAYTLIIAGVFVFSGLGQDRGLQDKFLIRSNGTVLKVKNLAHTANFYRSLLNYKIPVIEKGVKEIQFQTPDGAFIYLSEISGNQSGTTIAMNVRNGFLKLHAELLQRERQLQGKIGTERFISEIKKTEKDQRFLVSDPDQNQLIFFSPRKRSIKTLENISEGSATVDTTS